MDRRAGRDGAWGGDRRSPRDLPGGVGHARTHRADVLALFDAAVSSRDPRVRARGVSYASPPGPRRPRGCRAARPDQRGSRPECASRCGGGLRQHGLPEEYLPTYEEALARREGTPGAARDRRGVCSGADEVRPGACAPGARRSERSGCRDTCSGAAGPQPHRGSRESGAVRTWRRWWLMGFACVGLLSACRSESPPKEGGSPSSTGQETLSFGKAAAKSSAVPPRLHLSMAVRAEVREKSDAAPRTSSVASSVENVTRYRVLETSGGGFKAEVTVVRDRESDGLDTATGPLEGHAFVVDTRSGARTVTEQGRTVSEAAREQVLEMIRRIARRGVGSGKCARWPHGERWASGSPSSKRCSPECSSSAPARDSRSQACEPCSRHKLQTRRRPAPRWSWSSPS